MTDPTKLIAEARALDAAATPGPWETGDPEHPGAVWTAADGDTLVARIPAGRWCEADAALIARARTLLPELADRLEACEKRLAIECEVGPEVPLCDECGGDPSPSCPEIWARIKEGERSRRP